MKTTFNLKKPNKDGLSLIYLKAYFKNEGCKFVYSTGEKIAPEDWDSTNKIPNNLNGRSKEADKQRTIKRQLDRYSNFFSDNVEAYKRANKDIQIAYFREDFDTEFKRTKSISSKFFEVYDIFITEKKNDYTENANTKSTIKRYEYNRKLLLEFEIHKKKKIHFNQINQSFYNLFVNYCVKQKKHTANTLRRNVGLFKTFLYWSLENRHTYKTDFQKFVAPKEQVTDEIALTLKQIEEVFNHDFSNNIRLEKVRDLFVFGCATGMRYSNYSKVEKKDIVNGFIKVRDQKNTDKVLEVPLSDYSNYILKKYDYNLPKLSNQKFNKYIKEVFEKIGYDEDVKKTIKLGKDIIELVIPFNKRISSHTARRSFITIMKNKKIPDKVIMEYTGHKSLEVFNKYYKPNEDDKKDFMKTVWTIKNTPLKKAE